MLTTELSRATTTHKATRYAKILNVLQPEQPSPTAAPTPLEYALIHHALDGATRAARAGDTSGLNWYRQAPTITWPTVHGGHQRIVLNPKPGELLTGETSDTPYYLLAEDSRPASDPLRHLVSEAAANAAATGFGALLHEQAAIVVLTEERSLAQTIRNSTTTRLPGTIFTDYTNSPEVLGRDLVHEAGHNWLNDVLAATGAPSTGQFYSPWRACIRPAFGFLHACWAFPLTMIYTAAVLEQGKADPAVLTFLTAYLEQQRSLLKATSSDHPAAVQLVPDATLRGVLQDVYAKAQNL